MANPWEMDWGPSSTPAQDNRPPWEQDWGEPRGIVQQALDYDRQFTSAVAGGAVEGVATALRGAGAGAEAGPAGEGRTLETAIDAILSGGQDPSQAIETARQFGPRFQDVTQQPLYQAGERVSEWGRSTLPSTDQLNPVVRDIGSGLGSVISNIAVGAVPLVGPAGLIGFGTSQGRGEAAERAVKAGATPEQQVQASQLGAGPGLTDFVDIALTRAGVGGAGASRLRRALVRLAEGGLIEGTQEGVQQFLQNAIAQGVYKPEQDLTEDVLYSALVGAIVGGGIRAATTPRTAAQIQPDAAQLEADRIAREMQFGGAQPPPGGQPAPVAPTTAEPPPPAGPEDYGLGPTPTTPPGVTTASPTQPVDTTLDLINQIGTAPTPPTPSPAVAPVDPALTPGATPTATRRGYPAGTELRHEDGMWNVYHNGELLNGFGARSDADNYIRNGFKIGTPPASTAVGPELLPPKPAPVPPTQVDPNVKRFIDRKTAPLKVQDAAEAQELIGRGVPQIDGAQPNDYAANVNPSGKNWTRFDDTTNDVFVVDPQGRPLASVMQVEGDRFQASFYAPIGRLSGQRAHPGQVRRVYESPLFYTQEAAKAYAEAVVDSGRFDNSVDVKPFLDRDLSEVQARRRRSNFYPVKEEITAKPGVNVGRLAPLLGKKLYGDPDDLPKVSVKEILQNGFDAIKTMIEKGLMAKGRLDVVMDHRTRTITISDNGSGMTPDILATKFLEIAGTQKESERASGGLGIAKMLFLFENQKIEVITMRDGKVATLMSSGPELFRAMAGEGPSPKVTVKPPGKDATTLFPEGHGTVVRVKVPETYIDDSTGQKKEIYFPSTARYFEVMKYSPLFADIDVTMNGAPMDNIGSTFPIKDYTKLTTARFKWGNAHVYVTKQPKSTDFANAHVLSNGLWQFSFNIPKDPNEPYGEKVNREFFIDVDAKVKPEHSGYPFDLNRQRFTQNAEKDFAKIFNWISVMYAKMDFVHDMKNYGDIEYLTVGPNGTQRSEKIKLQPEIPPSETAASVISEGDDVAVVDGRLVVNGRDIPDITSEELSKASLNFKEFKIDPARIRTDVPMLHDNVDVKISDSQTISISDLAREKFGDRFDEFVQQMGQAFIDLRDTVASIGVADNTGKGFTYPWVDMKKEAIGVSFDPRYRGVSIRIPFSGSFLNIAVPEFSDILRAAVGMVGTMVHELAHHKVRSHNAEFPAEMQRIIIHLDTHPSFDFHGFKQRVVDIVSQHDDVFQYINGVLTNGTFTVQPRGERFKDSGAYEAGDGSNVSDMGEARIRAERPFVVSRGTETGANLARTPFGRAKLSVRVSSGGQSIASQRAADQRILDADASGGSGSRGPGPVAALRQPEFDGTRERLEALFHSVGGTPTAVRAAASHADRMNWWYKMMAGLDQLLKANPMFLPLRRYFSDVQLMHNEEARLQDAALRVAKRWRGLSDEGDRLAGMFDEVANMRYRTADEVRRGIQRHPTADELRALITKYRLSADGVKLFDDVRKMFDGFLELVKANAFDAAKRIIKDPVRLAQKLDEIQASIDSMRARPYFPMMRFGRHYVQKKDASGRVTHFETFERRGVRSAESIQKAAFNKLNSTKAVDEVVTMGMLPEAAAPFAQLPPMLLETIKTQLALTPDQLQALEQIQLMQSSALNFKRMMKSDYVPGYSLDFKRAFARYFFHGARYYARTKYGHALRSHIGAAQAVPNNKANMIAEYMRDHLQNTILDAKGDFGIFKAGIFIWALGYMPAAATMNLLQTPTVTYSHLAGKFGGFGLGNKRAGQAIIKAAANVKNYYRRETYDRMGGFDYEALAYGIKTGRVSETQAPELAGLSAGNNLLFGQGGNTLQRGWTQFMEKGAFMFEMAEQFNRRVAFRAALDLAQKFPNSKAVKEATTLYSAEYESLQKAASGRRAFTAAEAAAIVTAVHTVDQTQFVYARYARPRFMRGRVPGTLFVFKKYLQSMLFWMGQNKSDVLPQYLVVMALLGGLGGLPGYDDLRDLIRAFAKWFWGKDFNLDKKARELVLSFTDGKLDPDLALHGLSRLGFGVPALLDLMGSWITGREGRGLTSQISSDPSNPQGRGQNVAFPVLDRHRALSMGPLLGFEPGKLLLPQSDRDLDHTMAEQVQKASGAVFGLGFNVYKALMSEKSATDFKRYEQAVPRAAGALSRAYRAYSEGRERGRGGPNSAPTVVPYDVRDTEQMMEIIFMGLGYQNLRQQARWDNILAKVDAEKFYDGKRNGLLAQYYEASLGGNSEELRRVREAIVEFNTELPDFARGQAISTDVLTSSMQQRARTRALREQGLPTQRRNMGISQEIDRLYREGAVDVRPVR